MPREINQSSRSQNPTLDRGNQSRGIVTVRRINIPLNRGQITVPAMIRSVTLKNIGAFAIAFNFNDDDPSDYWTLAISETSPRIFIPDTTVINAQGLAGVSIVQAIFEG